MLAHFLSDCPHDGCQEQIEYDQYDAHIDQCIFKRVMCRHCNEQYQRIGKDDHEANCLELIKFKNSELAAKLEEYIAEVANVRSDLESTRSELENVKRTSSHRKIQGEKSEAELKKVRSELNLVQGQLKDVKRSAELVLEKYEAELAKGHIELESINSQFQNVTGLTALFKCFQNDVLIAQVKQATETPFDNQFFYNCFSSYSAKTEYTGAKIYVVHDYCMYSDWNENRIGPVL